MRTLRPRRAESVAAARLRDALVPLVRQLRAMTADGRFTPTQTSVLSSIHREGPISVGDLAARERLSVPTISKVVAALEGEGMIERFADAADRRVCRVALSAAGATWMDRTRTRRDAWLAERIAELHDGDRQALSAAIPVLERLGSLNPPG